MILRILSFLFPQVLRLQAERDYLSGITEKLNKREADYQREFNERIRANNATAEADGRYAGLNNEHSVALSKIKDFSKRNSLLTKENGRLDSENKVLRERVACAEKRADDATRELVDALKTAGDSLGLRVTGRRLFSMAPVEAPPSEESRPPINVSQGAGRRFAGDLARQRNAEFFQRRAEQAGVANSEEKPN